MPDRSSEKPKRPRDTNELAAAIVRAATEEAWPDEFEERTLLLFCSEGQAARRVARLEQQNCRPNVGLKLRVRPQRRDGRKMTAEIAIINRTAVTLAADSAIALDVEGTSKIYNTADKLFELTTAYPVGVMVYNNMNYLEIPLEVVIKSYRNSKR